MSGSIWQGDDLAAAVGVEHATLPKHAAPTTDDRLRLTVLVDRDVAPIRGLVLGPDGRPGEPFEGWMELTGLIESARMRDRDQG